MELNHTRNHTRVVINYFGSPTLFVRMAILTCYMSIKPANSLAKCVYDLVNGDKSSNLKLYMGFLLEVIK